MKFEGTFVALVTPFNASGRLDESGYRALIRKQLKSGINGLVPCGSTGEGATLTRDEYRRCLIICMEESQGDVPVMPGIGTNATWKALEEAREAESLGVDALLVLAPYYNKPTQEGLYQHYAVIARQTRLPVMIYNIPSRCAVNIAPSTIVRLARDFKNIAAVKEASGNLDQVSEIIATAPKGFVVMSGDDNLTLPMLSVGARGVVSVVANIAPKEIAAMVSAFLNGDAKKAAALHRTLFPLVKSLFIETNPIPVKAALGLMGLCDPRPRLPLTPLSKSAAPPLKGALKKFGLI